MTFTFTMSKPSRRTKLLAFVIGMIGLGILLSASSCDSRSSAQKQAQDKADNAFTYIPKNDIERQNYNARTELADNPASLIWCSVYPTNPNVKAFTVPIVGKLTSGGKRPIPTSQVLANTDAYSQESPGPDGMYGTSGDYRYGFDPAGNYHDFYNIETYCTSVPTIIQKQTTSIDIGVAGDLNTLDQQVQAALVACQKRASNQSVTTDGKPSGVGDPTKACPEAARLLGL